MKKKQIIKLSRKIAEILAAMMMGLTISHQNNQIIAQETIDVGETGWKVKRPVMASACDAGCPWGELGIFLRL